MNTSENKRIAIIAAGELGQQIQHIAVNNGYHIVGFFDDVSNETCINGSPLLGKLSDIDDNAHLFDALVMGIGYKHFEARKNIFDALKAKYAFTSIIDKSAIIDNTANIGNGVVIYPGVVVDKGVIVEDNAIINIAVAIGHNTIVGAHSFICGGVLFAGRVNLGYCSFVGIHSSLSDDVNIAPYTVIGAHSLVLKNIDESYACYVGVPAKKIVPKHGLNAY